MTPEPTSSGVDTEGDDDGGMIRIEATRVNRLVDMVSELVIAQGMLREDELFSDAASLELRVKLVQAARIAGNLHEAAHALHLVALQGTFREVARATRARAAQLAKPIELHVEGDGTDLDRECVEMLVDPLTVIFAMALEEAIESRAAREAAGKNATAQLTLRARREGGEVVVEIEHDGRPIDRAALRERAKKRGLVDAQTTEAQVLALALVPGVASRDRTGSVAGCSAALARVARTVVTLGGTVSLHSEGATTRYSLRFPLEPASTDALLVRVGAHRYVIPVASVIRTLRADAGMVFTVVEKAEMLTMRGDVLPVVRLAPRLGERGCEVEQGVLVILHAGGGRVAVLVDEVLGRRGVVLKSLGSLDVAPIVVGGAILGDGLVGLVLDPEGLMIDVLRSSRAWSGAHGYLAQSAAKFLRAPVQQCAPPVEAGPRVATSIALLSVAHQVEVRITVCTQRRCAEALAMRLFGSSDDTLPTEVLEELANILMGGMKTAFHSERLELTGGLPQAVPPHFAGKSEGPSSFQKVVGLRVGDGMTLSVHLSMRARARRAVLPDKLVEGMVLVRDVLDGRGAPLLDGGTRLSSHMVERLRSLSSATHAIDVLLP